MNDGLVVNLVLAQTIGLNLTRRAGTLHGLCGEYSIPNLGRSFTLDTKFADLELTLSNPMHQFNAADSKPCTKKPL
jgi:hypothetical protein